MRVEEMSVRQSFTAGESVLASPLSSGDTERKRKTPPMKPARKARKNDREKQRRFELNDRFETLTALLNVEQGGKCEKIAVLSSAIHDINALRAENNELRIEKAGLRAELSKLTSFLQKTFPGAALTAESQYRYKTNTKAGFDSFSAPSTFGIAQSSQGGFIDESMGPDRAMMGMTVAKPHATYSSNSPFALTSGATSLDEEFDVFS